MIQNKRALLDSLRTGLVDCDMQSSLGFLCLLAGVPVYLWGKPGTGKSTLARRLLNLVQDSRPGGRECLEPEAVSAETHLLLIDDLDWRDSVEPQRLKALLESHPWRGVVATGSAMPENGSHASLQDYFAVRLPLPNLEDGSLLARLLTGAQSVQSVNNTPHALSLSAITAFQDALNQVELHPDCLSALSALSAYFTRYNQELDHGGIGWPVEISPRRWLALTRLIRAHAALEERSQAGFFDCLLLGTAIWGNGRMSDLARKGFEAAIDAHVNEITSGLHQWGQRLPMLKPEIQRALNASRHLFKTVSVAHTDCIEFRVVLGYDHLTLFAPAHFIGTQENFTPWKEGGKEEPRLRCNFNGTTTCKIMVDAGARQKVYRTTSVQAATYEEYGSFTAEILVKDHEETIEKNTERLDALRKDVQAGLELYATGLAELKNAAQDKALVNGSSLIPREILHRFRETLMARFDQFRSEAQELNHFRKLLSGNA